MTPGDVWLWERFGKKWRDYAAKIEKLKAIDKAVKP